MNRIIYLIICFLVPSISAAALSLDSSEDRVRIISSTNTFGDGPDVVLQDDFDIDSSSAPLDKWKLSGMFSPIQSGLESITGKSSGMSRFIGNDYNSTAEYKNLGGMSSAYLSYYFKVKRLNGAPSRNIKLARLSSGYSNKYLQPTGITLFPHQKNGIFYTYSSADSDSKIPTKWIEDYADGEWHRAEYYLVLSNPAGAANGRSRLSLNGDIKVDFKNAITEETGGRIEWLTLPYYVAHSPGGDYEIYYDNVFLSRDLARVELCDSETYDSCKNAFIPKILEWNERSITLDSSTLEPHKSYYVYVFRKDGSLVEQKGVKLCPSCPMPPTIFP